MQARQKYIREGQGCDKTGGAGPETVTFNLTSASVSPRHTVVSEWTAEATRDSRDSMIANSQSIQLCAGLPTMRCHIRQPTVQDSAHRKAG